MQGIGSYPRIRYLTLTVILFLMLILFPIQSVLAYDTNVVITLYDDSYSTADYEIIYSQIEEEDGYHIIGNAEIAFSASGAGSTNAKISINLSVIATGFWTDCSIVTDEYPMREGEDDFDWSIWIPLYTKPQNITVTINGTYHKVNSPDSTVYDIAPVYAYVEVTETNTTETIEEDIEDDTPSEENEVEEPNDNIISPEEPDDTTSDDETNYVPENEDGEQGADFNNIIFFVIFISIVLLVVVLIIRGRKS